MPDLVDDAGNVVPDIDITPSEVSADPGTVEPPRRGVDIAVVHSARANTAIVAMEPNTHAVVIGPRGEDLGSTRNPPELYLRLYEQLLRDTGNAESARSAAIASFASILGVDFAEAERRSLEAPIPPPPPIRSAWAESFSRIQPMPYIDNADESYTRRMGASIVDDYYHGSFFVPSGDVEVNWKANEPEPFILPRTKRTPIVDAELANTDYEILARIIDNAARNIVDVFNERLSEQPKGLFASGPPPNPLTFNELNRMLAILVADGLETKWHFDRERFMATCGIEES